MSTGNSSTYRTLDLVKAVCFGWAEHYGLKETEVQVLQFIALRGKRNEAEMSFAWFPLGGQEWWAAHMGMSVNKLKKALAGLRKRRMIVNLEGSQNSALFVSTKGYGIPEGVMYSAYWWYKDREDIRFTRAPNTPEELISDSELEIPEVPNPHSEVPNPHSEVPEWHLGFCISPDQSAEIAIYPYKEPEKNTQLFTQGTTLSGSSLKKDKNLRYEDEWSIPSDAKPVRSAKKPVDDFAIPKEAREKKSRPTVPSSRLTDMFFDEWSKARITKVSLSVPWNSKRVFQNQLNKLLEVHTEEEIASSMKVFFRMVLAGQVTLKSDELWKDFWNNRGRAVKISRQQNTAVTADQEEELRRWRERQSK
jgi:hypothetical protein